MRVLFIILLSIISLNVSGQTYYRLDATNNGQTINLTCPITNTHFADDGSNSTHYSNGVDYTITFCAPAGKLLKFDFGCGSNLTNERIDQTDTLYMYDGNSTASPLLYKVTGNPSNSDKLTYFGEQSDFAFTAPSECITFRLRSDGSNNQDGWDACITCVDPVVCGNNEPASDLFAGAPFICNLNGYCGTTSPDYGEDYPVNLNQNGGTCPSGANFLGTIENNSWLKFIADSTYASFEFNVPLGGSCYNGIQTAIFSYDGSSLSRLSSCANSDGAWAGNFSLSSSTLIVGETYYIMVDGNAGDNCDYTITTSNGVALADAGPDIEICPGETLNLNVTGPPGATYTWNALNATLINATGDSLSFIPTIIPTTYVVEITGGTVCETQTDTVSSVICKTLPIELLGFWAECESNYVQLKWQTASEVNNDYFVIEKAGPDNNFVPIALIDGAGNSSSTKNYSYKDYELSDEPISYRLKQIDFNGDYSYSDILILNNCSNTYGAGDIYYNHFTNEITVNYNSQITSEFLVRIYDIQGKLIIQEKLSSNQNSQKVKLGSEKLISGSVYFVNIVTDTFIRNTKFLIPN